MKDEIGKMQQERIQSKSYDTLVRDFNKEQVKHTNTKKLFSELQKAYQEEQQKTKDLTNSLLEIRADAERVQVHFGEHQEIGHSALSKLKTELDEERAAHQKTASKLKSEQDTMKEVSANLDVKMAEFNEKMAQSFNDIQEKLRREQKEHLITKKLLRQAKEEEDSTYDYIKLFRMEKKCYCILHIFVIGINN